MILDNERRQHPVGQGFFHSGFILEDREIRLSYVYDCGSMAAYKGERDREIDSFHRQAANLKTLDLLYLSHVHADHINGVEKLLETDAIAHALELDTV
ncbi:MBL fold metallo-hydrolase [Brucella intermedia]|nr:MBL fold metallo-hydrolase [Brucella intermedia]